jgi:hypothetical protein
MLSVSADKHATSVAQGPLDGKRYLRQSLSAETWIQPDRFGESSSRTLTMGHERGNHAGLAQEFRFRCKDGRRFSQI